MIVLGVDPATTRVALADDEGHACSVDIPKGEGAKRMASIHAATQRLVGEFVAPDDCPDIVFIESPAGHVHPSLWQAFGVIGAAIWLALSEVENFPVSVLAIGPTEWKRVLLDDGSASKLDIMDWARARGYAGKVQDEADALGIARAGLRLLKGPAGQ